MTALKVILGILGFLFLYQVVIRITRRIFHFPAPAFVGRFLDSDFRRRLQPPDKLIRRSGISEGMTVVDLGCGSGAYTTFVARAVGPRGRVYAVDIQPAMLKQLESKLARAENRDVTNIELRQASAYDLPFDDASVDLVYLVTVLQEIPDKDRTLREVRRVLRPGGMLAVTEFLPDPDYRSVATTVKMCQAAGFTWDDAQGNPWNYTARFSKPGAAA